jgi:hypothetical protein
LTHDVGNILASLARDGNRTSGWLLLRAAMTTLWDDDATRQSHRSMSWALEEFFAAIEEEFGVPVGDSESLETPGDVIDFVTENTPPVDGMDEDEFREHVAGVVGEAMARTLGVTRYSESSRFVQDLHVR